MTPAVGTTALPPDLRVAAPLTGIQLGRSGDDAVLLRLFRPNGTRVAALSGVLPVALVALRASAAGAVVRVISPRSNIWAPVLRHCPGGRLAPPGTPMPPAAGPMVVIDDRPSESRELGGAGPWQCRFDIRSPWVPADLATFAHADLVLLGLQSGEMADAVSSIFGVEPRAAAQLVNYVPDVVGIVNAGRIRFTTLAPSPAEAAALTSAR